MADLIPSSQLSIFMMVVIMAAVGLSIYLPWRKKATATSVLTTSIIFIFILQLILTSDLVFNLPVLNNFEPLSTSVLYKDLGFYPDSIINGQSVYQFITSMFLHSGFIHMILNFIGLFILGIQLEKKLGWYRFLILYYGSGIIAGAVVLMISPFDQLGQSMNTVSIGASGAIFGIIGGYWLLYPKDRIFFPLPLYFIRMTNKWPVWLIFLIYGGISTVFLLMQKDDNISHLAHMGGLVGSFPIAALIRPPNEPDAIKELRSEDLSKYARTKKQKYYLEKAMIADEEDIRNAWLDEFFQSITCEKCKSSHMSFEDGRGKCPKCGMVIKP